MPVHYNPNDISNIDELNLYDSWRITDLLEVVKINGGYQFLNRIKGSSDFVTNEQADSGDLPTPGLQGRIIVNNENADTTLGGTIDSTKQYFIDEKILDFSLSSCTVPSTGIFIKSYNNENIIFSDTADYTLFTGGGDVFFDNVSFEVSGTNSKVYDMTDPTGFNAIELTAVNYNNCTSLGELNGFRQGLEFNTGRFGGTPNLILSGTWIGGYRATTTITRSLDDSWTGALFEEGTSFVMNNRFLTDMNLDLGTNGAFIDFRTANFTNPSTLQLNNCIISRDGVKDIDDSNILPNIVAGDLIAEFRNNTGIRNTFEGFTADLTTEAETTITTVNTYVNLAGTFTVTENQHFDTDGENLGDNPVEFKMSGSITLNGGANDFYEIGVYKTDGTTETFVRSFKDQVKNTSGGVDSVKISLDNRIELLQGERPLLKVKNNTDTTNCTGTSASYYNIIRL